VVQLDYTLRHALWIECGACPVEKLDRLAVKVPEAELWVVQPSVEEAQSLLHSMARHGLRRNRYQLLAFDREMMRELAANLASRNRVFWVDSRFDPPELQFDYNGLWFESSFSILRF
jgi:hypothetical protein